MTLTSIIKQLEQRLGKRCGLAKLHFLISERAKLDSGVFAQTGWKHSEYKDLLFRMLEQDDVAPALLKEYFDDYKEEWGEARRRLFDSTEELPYEEFLKEFGEYLPQDIKDSIKKCKSADISNLELPESIRIIEKYYKVRVWLNEQIRLQVEEHRLTDIVIKLVVKQRELKYEWQGQVNELTGLLEELQGKGWLHIPASSNREKTAILLSAFGFSGKEKGSVGYVENVYKKSLHKEAPFKKIEAKR